MHDHRDEATSQLGTRAVAAASGYSVQQVRDLEALGVIPPAPRAVNGYRQFSSAHLRALRAYRDLAHAVGPVDARHVLREIRHLPAGEGTALLGRLHTRLSEERERTLAARRALTLISTEADTDAEPVETDSMTITELSQALGVRASALRFWESAGLVAPERVPTAAGTTRRYDLPAIREARITAALRAGGHRIPDVEQAITALRDLGDASQSVTALNSRLANITDRTLALLRAGALVAEMVGIQPRPEQAT